MVTERWQSIRRIFDAALDVPESERAAWVREACGDDVELRDRVEELLATDARTDGEVLDRGAVGRLVHDVEAPSMVGVSVDGYRITAVIGAGGMGTVYSAEQGQPKRTVALKMMRSGLDSPAGRRRFEYESEVLARLRHPGIAQVFDAGTWAEPDTGRRLPYFAMELVEDALPLDRYVAATGGDLRALLGLFGRVCDAVHHGHQRGFIHRDLKPANILVDRSGQPKVIDFGIARATDVDREQTLLTAAGQVVGTLSYMSPEQVDGETDSADITSDVYALGVILYELLTGELPFDLTGKSLHTALEIVRTHQPERPSRRGARPGSEPSRRKLPEDLDWIVLKAIDKDRGLRYRSAAELGEELRRLLADEPVTARAPTTGYRLRKFARRHRVAVTAGAAIVLALLSGTVLATAGLWRATRAEELAREEAEILGDVNRFMREMFMAARPGAMGIDVRLVDVLEDAADRVANLYEERPRLRAELHTTLGLTFEGIGRRRAALEQLEAALALTDEVGVDHAVSIGVFSNLGILRRREGRLDEARSLLERALEGCLRQDDEATPEVAVILHNLGAVHHTRAEYADSAEYYRRALLVHETLRTTDTDHGLSTAVALAAVQRHLGATAVAEDRLRAGISRSESVLGVEHPTTLTAKNELALLLRETDRPGESKRIFEELLAAEREVFGATHHRTLGTVQNLAVALKEAGDLAEAERRFRECIDAYRATGAAASLHGLIATHNLAIVLELREKREEAARLFSSNLREAEARLPAGHWMLGNFRKGYGVCLTGQGRFEAAEEMLLSALEVLEATLGPANPRARATRDALVDLYEAWQKPAEAERFRSPPAADDR